MTATKHETSMPWFSYSQKPMWFLETPSPGWWYPVEVGPVGGGSTECPCLAEYSFPWERIRAVFPTGNLQEQHGPSLSSWALQIRIWWVFHIWTPIGHSPGGPQQDLAAGSVCLNLQHCKLAESFSVWLAASSYWGSNHAKLTKKKNASHCAEKRTKSTM